VGPPGSESGDLAEPVRPSKAGSEVESCLASRIEAAPDPIERLREPLEGISS
jgi:hypothetical protein